MEPEIEVREIMAAIDSVCQRAEGIERLSARALRTAESLRAKLQEEMKNGNSNRDQTSNCHQNA